jgi:hypothetical protein
MSYLHCRYEIAGGKKAREAVKREAVPSYLIYFMGGTEKATPGADNVKRKANCFRVRIRPESSQVAPKMGCALAVLCHRDRRNDLGNTTYLKTHRAVRLTAAGQDSIATLSVLKNLFVSIVDRLCRHS